MDFTWKADVQPLRRLIDSIRATSPDTQSVADAWLVCALAERNAPEAKDALLALGETPFSDDVVQLSRPFMEGVIARMMNDNEQARAAFTAARAEQEKIVKVQPNYAPALCVLGLIDAGLGRKEEALSEGRRAVELLPVEKDALAVQHDQVSGNDCCLGWRQRPCLRTACHRHSSPGWCHLWQLETDAVLGSPARRSAL